MIKPSIELLREVIGIHILKMGEGDETHIAHWGSDNKYYTTINIYELMHLMKEWAYREHDYCIGSWQGFRSSYCDIRRGSINGARQTETNGETEFDAVVKACEWILKQN